MYILRLPKIPHSNFTEFWDVIVFERKYEVSLENYKDIFT